MHVRFYISRKVEAKALGISTLCHTWVWAGLGSALKAARGLTCCISKQAPSNLKYKHLARNSYSFNQLP